jgi:hypothetical protein
LLIFIINFFFVIALFCDINKIIISVVSLAVGRECWWDEFKALSQMAVRHWLLHYCYWSDGAKWEWDLRKREQTKGFFRHTLCFFLPRMPNIAKWERRNIKKMTKHGKSRAANGKSCYEKIWKAKGLRSECSEYIYFFFLFWGRVQIWHQHNQCLPILLEALDAHRHSRE